MTKTFMPSVTDGFTQLRVVLSNGRVVSTVKLNNVIKAMDSMLMLSGVDRPYINAPYGDFETMVFPEEGNWQELDCRRYSTAEEAMQGHEEMVRLWSNES